MAEGRRDCRDSVLGGFDLDYEHLLGPRLGEPPGVIDEEVDMAHLVRWYGDNDVTNDVSRLK